MQYPTIQIKYVRIAHRNPISKGARETSGPEQNEGSRYGSCLDIKQKNLIYIRLYVKIRIGNTEVKDLLDEKEKTL